MSKFRQLTRASWPARGRAWSLTFRKASPTLADGTSVMDTLSRADQPTARIEQLAVAPLPTRHGMFQLRVFRWE